MLWNYFVTAALITLVSADQYTLFYNALETQTVADLAVLDYDPVTKTATVNLVTPELPGGDYCVGTKQLPNHDCITFLSSNIGQDFSKKAFHIYLNENGVDHLAVVRGSGEVVVHEHEEAAKPIMDPESVKYVKKKNEPKTEKVVQKKIVKQVDADGKEVEVEVEEEVVVEVDERSWVQKNWMYLTLPLLVFMLFGGEEKKS